MKPSTMRIQYLLASVLALTATASNAQDPKRAVTDLFNKIKSSKPAAAPAVENAATNPAAAVGAVTPAATQPAAATGGGKPLARYTFSADGKEVTDTVSGLVWRRCAEGMQWNGSTCAGEASKFFRLNDVLRHSHAEAAATKLAWRVPAIAELETLVNLNFDGGLGERGTAGNDMLAFPGTPVATFWSSTLYYSQRGDRDRTKTVSFANGLQGYLDNGEDGRLRLVRNAPGNDRAAAPDPIPVTKALANNQVAADARFAVSANGQEVTDRKTELTWRRCPEGMTAKGNACTGKATTFNFDDALKYGEKMKASGWRLPTNEELRSLVDESRKDVVIDLSAFPGTPPEHFWTSVRANSTEGKAVTFYNGYMNVRYYTNLYPVRLVKIEK